MASSQVLQRNQEATVYVGNLEEKVSDELLWELMLQAGPIVNVHIPKDKINGKHMTYGFVEYKNEDDAEYAIKVLNMIKIGGKSIKVNRVSQDNMLNDVGANIFVGNLDAEVDEKLLYDTFSAFGGISQTPKVMRDVDLGASKGYGFISFDAFESSDMAIECMNGQFLCNRPIVVQYAFKRDTPGERHGSQAERMLAASSTQWSSKFKPNTNFSGGDGDISVVPTVPPAQIVNMSGVGLPSSAKSMSHQPSFGVSFPLTSATTVGYPLQHVDIISPLPNHWTPNEIALPPTFTDQVGIAPSSLNSEDLLLPPSSNIETKTSEMWITYPPPTS